MSLMGLSNYMYDMLASPPLANNLVPGSLGHISYLMPAQTFIHRPGAAFYHDAICFFYTLRCLSYGNPGFSILEVLLLSFILRVSPQRKKVDATFI